MEWYYNIIDYVFPVTIVERYDVLYIVDRRLNFALTVSTLGALGLGAFTAYLGWKMFWYGAAWWIVFLILGVIGLVVWALFTNFQEVYVFDKPRDTYTFTRQSVFRKDVLEGSLSQFRAVQVHERTQEESTSYTVALLMQGLMLGQSDTQVLRENPPSFNSQSTETKIAASISKFLNIDNNGVVSVGYQA